MSTSPSRLLLARKARQGNLYAADCPSRHVLDHLTSRWGSLILILLLEGTHRFSELRRTIGGVSEKMLAQSLQQLETDGLLTRTVFPTIPPKVEYSLTPLGTEAATLIRSLTDWVELNVARVLKAQERTSARRSRTASGAQRSA